jgi:hyperosmotically inducible periplasmic protein
MLVKSIVRKGLNAMGQPARMKQFLLASLLIAPTILPMPAVAADKKQHQDAFVTGDPNEARMSKQVRHELLMLPYYGVFDDLAFRVDGTTVTLLGAVTRPTLKSDAESRVKKVEGVTQVINEIELLPLSGMDDQTRRAVFNAIYRDQSLGIRYGMGAVPSIHIIVKNGNVTLEGIVDNQGDKDLANLRANGVPNVFKVNNELQVGGN